MKLAAHCTHSMRSSCDFVVESLSILLVGIGNLPMHLRGRLSEFNNAGKTLCLGMLISALFLAGCAVGPKYHQPSVQLQPFHNAPAIAGRATDSTAPRLDAWWTGFQDPELTRIIQRALDQNLDLQAAVTRVEQARAVAKEAGAKRLPSGTLNAR